MCNCNELKQITLPTGPSGNSPYIGGNNNWWINGVDTGVLAEGTNGQSIDHSSFTSTTFGGGTPNEPGETDTYTIWGDVGETINLGTFTVYTPDTTALEARVNDLEGYYPSGTMLYLAKLTQSGVNNPVETIIIANPNSPTFGSWTRHSAGTYRLASMGLSYPDKDKIFFTLSNGSYSTILGATWINNQTLQLQTKDAAGVLSDGLLYEASIGITVFP